MSKTKIPGKNSILVDLGSNINIIGRNTEKEFAESARKAGLETIYISRQSRLHVDGVGSDAAFCDHETQTPIAVKFKDQPATKELYRANIADGCGANMPAIIGVRSETGKDSVLVLREGKEFNAFPEPGGYKIEWSPGTKLLPMTHAPSGHLLLERDYFV